MIKDGKKMNEYKHEFKKPRIVNGIEIEDIRLPPLSVEIGGSVAIRPSSDEYEDKTYLGIFLGGIARIESTAFNTVEKTIIIYNREHPAFFVPKLKKIIFGFESWWKPITNIDTLKEITDEDIQNTWYVKALKEIDGSDKQDGK